MLAFPAMDTCVNHIFCTQLQARRDNVGQRLHSCRRAVTLRMPWCPLRPQGLGLQSPGLRSNSVWQPEPASERT